MADENADKTVRTDGQGGRFQVGSVGVTAPGLVLELRSRLAAPALPQTLERMTVTAEAATAPLPLADDLDQALADQGFSPHLEDLEMRPVSIAGAVSAPLAQAVAAPLAQEAAAPSQVAVDVPVPEGQGVVLFEVQANGIVQVHLPTTPRVADVVAAEAAAPFAAPRTARFLIPVEPPPPSLPGVVTAFAAESFGGRVLKFFRFDLVDDLVSGSIEKVTQFLAQKVESRSKTEGVKLYDPASDFPMATPAALQEMAKEGPVLLLVHGIFSSLGGAFGDLATALPGEPVTVPEAWKKGYGGRIIGYDHWTVAKTPLENASDLLQALPDGMSVDVLCHSRGGLVVRALLEHPALDALRKAKIKAVGRTIYVGAANQGSALASPDNWDRLLNIFFAIGSIPGVSWAGVAVDVLVGLTKVLAHGVGKLPSVEALAPDVAAQPNGFLQALNGATFNAVRLVTVRANFDHSQNVALAAVDLGVDTVFQGASNDLVVPFDGVADLGPNAHFVSQRDLEFDPTGSQAVVFHTNYFHQSPVRDLLRTELP